VIRLVDSTSTNLFFSFNNVVDDPDGTAIYNETMKTICGDAYANVRCDICVVRAPPEDRILNALLRGAKVALQLSHREGFEVKVTEALHKGVPIICYRAGGIPLQLPQDYPYLVEIGNVEKVAEAMFELMTNEHNWKIASQVALSWGCREEYWTVWQTLNWLWLVYREATGWKPQVNSFQNGKFYPVKEEWKLWYQEQQKIKVKSWGDDIPQFKF
jgi:glycosyltransferase involved in cell wall biosynthesis